MKPSLKSFQLLFCLISFMSYRDAFSQQSMANNRQYTMLAKVDQLFDAGFTKVAASIVKPELIDKSALRNYSYGEEQLLQFYKLASGINKNDVTALQESIQLYQRAEKKSLSILLAFYIGDYYFRNADYVQAIDYLEKTDALYLSNDLNEKIQYEKGLSYFSLKKFDNAKPYFKSIVQLDQSPYKTDARYYLGFIAFSDRLYDEALVQFKELQNDPYYKRTIPFYLAFIYNEKGNVEKAIQTGEAYLKQEDALHKKETMQFLASIYFNKGDFAKSVGLYEKALTMGIVLEPVQRYELGVGYHEIGKFTNAIEQLKPLSNGKDSIAGQSMFYLGDSFLQVGDKVNARNSFMYSASLPVSSEKREIATLYFAKLSLELGFQDQGFQKLNDFITQYPNSVMIKEAKEILIQYYAKTNNFKQAIILLENTELSSATLLKIAPKIYYGRSMELINDNEYELAGKYLNEISKFRSSAYYAPAIFWKGEIEFRQENYANAIKNLTEYTKQNASPLGEASNENAYYDLGYSYFELENYEKALPYFEKIINSNKQSNSEMYRESMLRAADCYFMQKNTQKAKALYTKLVDKNGYGADYAYFQLAIIEGIRDPAEKIKLLKDIERKFPTAAFIPILTMELANTYISEEEYEKAIPYLVKIKTLVSDDDELLPESYLKLGVSYYNLEKPDEAIEQFKKLLSSFPASEQAAEAIESAKNIFIEKGRVDDYQDFLSSGGRSINSLQKDSLLYQIVQSRFIEPDNIKSFSAINDYKSQFPNGLFIADVLNFEAELFQKNKKWNEAAASFDMLSAKGPSKYQEKAYRSAAKIYFFELKDYQNSILAFKGLYDLTNATDIKLESLKGLVRAHYFMKDWTGGYSYAEMLYKLNTSPDDRAFSNIILGYKEQLNASLSASNNYFTQVIKENVSSLSAEAGFQIAYNTFQSGDLDGAEKNAMSAIEKSGSNDYWAARSYILLGDIFVSQKDYFNAKATLQSVIENCRIPELKEEAVQKLKNIESLEKVNEKKL